MDFNRTTQVTWRSLIGIKRIIALKWDCLSAHTDSFLLHTSLCSSPDLSAIVLENYGADVCLSLCTSFGLAYLSFVWLIHIHTQPDVHHTQAGKCAHTQTHTVRMNTYTHTLTYTQFQWPCRLCDIYGHFASNIQLLVYGLRALAGCVRLRLTENSASKNWWDRKGRRVSLPLPSTKVNECGLKLTPARHPRNLPLSPLFLCIRGTDTVCVDGENHRVVMKEIHSDVSVRVAPSNFSPQNCSAYHCIVWALDRKIWGITFKSVAAQLKTQWSCPKNFLELDESRALAETPGRCQGNQ